MIVITTIDTLPDHCYECPCHDGESGYCQADKERRYSEYRPYWCPLKEIVTAWNKRTDSKEQREEKDTAHDFGHYTKENILHSKKIITAGCGFWDCGD